MRISVVDDSQEDRDQLISYIFCTSTAHFALEGYSVKAMDNDEASDNTITAFVNCKI